MTGFDTGDLSENDPHDYGSLPSAVPASATLVFDGY